MSYDFDLPAYGWAPRPDQLPLWQRLISPDLRKASIVAHRRYGKDELALQALAVHAMSRVGSYWYCLPEYEQARKAIWTMVNWRTGRARIDDAFPPEIVAKRDNETMHLTLESGSTVQLVGSDRVDSLVGGGQIGIVLSEAALSKPEAKMFFMPILEESRGWLMEISTPRGKNHFHRSHVAAMEDMQAGDPSVLAAYVPASKTGVFSDQQLFRIKMDLIREHGQNLGEALFNQEYLCSWTAAVVGAVWGKELTDLEADGRVRPLRFDRRFPVSTSWDIGVGDQTVILFWQQINNEFWLIDAIEGTDIGLDSYIPELKARHFERGFNYHTHFGPHDIQQREWVRGLSRKEEARRMGLEFKRVPNTRVKTQISAAAQLLRRVVVNKDSPGALAALERFKGYHYPKMNSNGVQSTTPVHDDNSHASSALMTYAVAQASKLGVTVGDGPDPALGTPGATLAPDGSLMSQKFDPRVYDTHRVFQGNSINPWPEAGSAPARGAFG